MAKKGMNTRVRRKRAMPIRRAVGLQILRRGDFLFFELVMVTMMAIVGCRL